MNHDELVCIDFKTAEFLCVLIGQVQWGDAKRRASACALLCEAMGPRKMETSLECFNIKEEVSPVTKTIKAILSFLRSKPGTEDLVTAIQSGEYLKRNKK
jgi:hypothetical protein